jgi:hypothetical protein
MLLGQRTHTTDQPVVAVGGEIVQLRGVEAVEPQGVGEPPVGFCVD